MSLTAFRTIGRKIVCVGRNYKDHALELGNDIPSDPLLFMKGTNAYIEEGEKIVTPNGCKNLHQEVELGVIFGKTAKNICKADAMDYVGGYTIALDMTARDFQDEAKKKSTPWFLAKSFDTSCPVAKFVPKQEIPNPHALEIYCKINGKDQQRCGTDAMIFDIPTLIEYTSQFVTLEMGDLLLTGTPAGVCKINSGDELEIGITGKLTAKFIVQ